MPTGRREPFDLVRLDDGNYVMQEGVCRDSVDFSSLVVSGEPSPLDVLIAEEEAQARMAVERQRLASSANVPVRKLPDMIYDMPQLLKSRAFCSGPSSKYFQ